jgi:mannose/fructose-specific phosphotransferase system component IIA
MVDCIRYTVPAMTQILVVGHGAFATTLLETARMLTGSTGHARAVQFPVGTGVSELTDTVSAAIDALIEERDGDRERVLVLADIAGGSPARVALGEALAGRAEVVTGANLPMLIDALFAPDTTTPDELARQVAGSAQSGIRNMGAEIREGGVLA